jgi:HEAT repeat protein
VTGGDFLGADLSVWTFWWDFNKDPYLQLKKRLYEATETTGLGEFNVGEGERIVPRDTYRPSPKQVRESIAPALLEALESETNNDVVTGCLIALAKIGDVLEEDGASPFESVIRGFLGDSQQEIAETAAISLGILGHDSSVPILTALLLDEEPARAAIGKSSVPDRTRAFAAYALGLVGTATASEDVRHAIVRALAQPLRAGESASLDVPVACVIGMGLTPLATMGEEPPDGGARPDPAEGRIQQVLALLDLFESDADSAIRTHAPVSLARLIDGIQEPRRTELVERAAGVLVDYLDRRTGREAILEQGAILALGRLGDCDPGGIDAGIRDTLLGLSDKAPTAQTKNFASIALAQIGARAGNEDPSAGRGEVRKALLGSLARGSNSGRSWSAIALGVLGNGLNEAGIVTPDIARAVRTELEDAKSPELVGALCVSAGLLGDAESLEALREKLGTTKVEETRGFVALGLGLLGERGAIREIETIVRQSEYRADLLKQAAIALGLLGDKTVVPTLTDMLAAARSLASQAAIASALGFIGDARSIDPLVAMLRDDSLTDTARGFAAAALGIVGDTDPLPWNARISIDLNYRAAPATLNANSSGTGVLNIL